MKMCILTVDKHRQDKGPTLPLERQNAFSSKYCRNPYAEHNNEEYDMKLIYGD
jgi:hypothetical protein